MKKIFLFLVLAFFTLSCKKVATKQNEIATLNETQISKQVVNNDEEIGIMGVTLELHVRWYSLYQDCLPGTWYCWVITTNAHAKSYIKINNKEKLITFGIDNSLNSDYHKKFIKGSNFNFPEDTYIKREILNAGIGLNKEIYVSKGLYHLDNIDGILTITAPYSIVD